MAQFPIEYSQSLPSGKGPAATTNVDLSAPYRAMQQAGGAIAQVASQVRDASDASEFSSLKMQQEMRWNAAYRQMQTEFDETKRNEIYQSAVKDIQGMKSKSGRVNTALTEHLNSKMPQYQDQYFNLDLAQKKVVAEERYNTVGQYQLETGKLEEYYETLDERLAVGNITPVKHEYLKKYAYVDSFLAQARKEVDKDPSFAIALLDSMPTSADKASNEQLDEKDKLITHAQTVMRWQKKQSDNAEVEVILNMHNNLDKSPSEKRQLGEQYISQLSQSGLTPERTGIMIDRIESWQQGKRFETNPIVKSKLFEGALDIWRGNIDPDEYNAQLKEAWNQGQINESDYNFLHETATRTLKTSQAGALSDAIQATKNVVVDFSNDLDFAEFVKSLKKSQDKEKALQTRQLQFWHLSQYEAEMQDWLRANPQAGPMEFRQQAEKLRYSYMNWSADDIEFKLNRQKIKIQQEVPKYKEGDERVIDGKKYIFNSAVGKWDDKK